MITLWVSIVPSTDEFRKINELIFNAPVRLLIICYHFPHFSEVKRPWATKEDCGRHENKTQISWLPVLSLCLFPEQPLGRQRSSVNYFVFIKSWHNCRFFSLLFPRLNLIFSLNTGPSLTASVLLMLTILYSVSWTSVWQSLLCRCETYRETKWICSITQSLRYTSELLWAVPRQSFSHWHVSSLITFPGQLFCPREVHDQSITFQTIEKIPVSNQPSSVGCVLDSSAESHLHQLVF